MEKSLVEPGYFGGSTDNIKIYKNFIELEDLKVIQKFLPTINEWMDAGENQYADDGTCIYDASYWADRQCSWDILKKINIEVYNIVDRYIQKMKQFLEQSFNVELSTRPPEIGRAHV